MIIDYLAGTFSGIIVVLFGHPFDTTKTRLQTAPKGFYRSTFDCVKKTWKAEGLGGFYRGIFSPLSGQMFFRACAFGTFHTSVTWLQDLQEINHLPISHYCLAGMLTGLTVAFVEVKRLQLFFLFFFYLNKIFSQTPIDLVKTKLQLQIFHPETAPMRNFHNVRSCISYLNATQGFRALWRGFSGTLIRNIPANAMFFAGMSPRTCLVKKNI
jgi:solute carrier family 25 carnitine/acylcarnitine transporter 20/29